VTGPEHYAQAEQLLEEAAVDRDPLGMRVAAVGHAVLALVAATVPLDADLDGWRSVLEPPEPDAVVGRG
jgi:hypothetical protein